MPPADIPNFGRFSELMDPQGVMFSVITYLPMKPVIQKAANSADFIVSPAAYAAGF
jgi:hypothetical protein